MSATALLTLFLQVIATASPVITACVDRPHTHAGTAAPDCPMHHHQSPGTPDDAQRAYHGHAAHAGPAQDDGPQISCHCPQDVLSLYLGEVATVGRPLTRAPFVEASLLSLPTDASAGDHACSPPSPPPR